MVLYNRINKKELKHQLQREGIKRKTISFYRYIPIPDPDLKRDELYPTWALLGIFGRIHIANEGINAQMSVPETSWKAFITHLDQDDLLAGVPIKEAVEDDGRSFYKLVIKVKDKIVSDGLSDDLDLSNTGKYLNAREFNKAMEDPDNLVVDLRNYYESEVGHFENALLPDGDTFRQTLPLVVDLLKDAEDKKILLYCTGGIRCEKASAYLNHLGFEDVNQLHGGIIEYAKQVKKQGLRSKFIGKNFVFDDRLGEKITDDVVSHCHQCSKPCDSHTNCANDDCHLLFIQCESCAKKYDSCCTPRCQEIISLPIEEQHRRRKQKNLTTLELRQVLSNEAKHSWAKQSKKQNIYKSRLRPKLAEIISEEKR